MPQSLDAIYLHLVYSTLDRQPFLSDPELRAHMHAYLGGTAKQLSCPSLVVGGVADHVHLLVRMSRTQAVSDLVRDIKSNSSSFAKRHVPGFAWQSGYGVFSVGIAEVAAVSHYIEQQEAHHQALSFQDEYRALLREHGIEWDERFVWA